MSNVTGECRVEASTGAAAAPIAVASNVRWTHVAPTLLVVWIISMFDKLNISIVIANPGFLQEFGLNDRMFELGLLSSGLLAAYGVFAPVWGVLLDRIGARRVSLIAMVLWAITCAMGGAAAKYGTLFASRVLLGAAEAALYPLTLTLVASWFPLKERGRATAFWWSGTQIGPMLSGVVVTALILSFGWRGQFYALAVLTIAIPVPMLVSLVRDKPRQHPAVNEAEANLIEAGAVEGNTDAPGRLLRGHGLRSVLTNYRYWLVTLAISTNSIFFWGWSAWLPTYLRTSRGLSFSASGYLTFVIYGFAVLIILATGFLSDRLFKRAPLAALGWTLAGVFLMTATLVPSATLSIVMMTLALGGQQIGISNAETLMHSLVTAHDMSRSQGIRALATQIPGALSPAFMGYLLAGSSGFVGAFAVLAIAVVVSSGCMVVLSRQGL
jgi:sugar phosphate permease